MDFDTLRQANRERVGKFKNKHGQPAHTTHNGSDWTPAQWLQALVGELGEFANIRKKYERGDLDYATYAAAAAKELADVQTYLDLLAFRALDGGYDHPHAVHPYGIDLGEATRRKFNEVSRRVKVDVFITDDEVRYIDHDPDL